MIHAFIERLHLASVLPYSVVRNRVIGVNPNSGSPCRFGFWLGENMGGKRGTFCSTFVSWFWLIALF